MKVQSFLIISLGLILLVLPKVVFAQDQEASGAGSLAVADYIHIDDKEVVDGDIVCSVKTGGFELGKEEYDQDMMGVVSQNPAIALNAEDTSDSYPVVSSGTALVNVSSINGAIKKNDLITTSKTAGIGIKATKSGYVLGTAMADFNPPDKSQTGKIPVALNIHFNNSQKQAVQNSLRDIFSLSALAATESPSVVFKYFVAGLVIIAAVLAGIYVFGRTASRGLEALGRNPMAQRIIQLGIALNVVLTLAIVAAGVVVAFLILRL